MDKLASHGSEVHISWALVVFRVRVIGSEESENELI